MPLGMSRELPETKQSGNEQQGETQETFLCIEGRNDSRTKMHGNVNISLIATRVNFFMSIHKSFK